MPTNGHTAWGRLVLTGFMGSGKTTVGRLLAAHLGWQFLDLDEVIAAGQVSTVPRILAEQGEPAFRAMEHRYLAALLGREHLVISLGGGAPESEALCTLLQQRDRTAVIYLQGAFQDLYARCVAQGQDPTATARPLLGNRQEGMERFRRRQTAYAAVATYAVDACSGTAEEVTTAILECLGRAASS